MMIRIVKMTFDPSKTEEFQELFETNKSNIRSFEGCNRLELLRDKNQPNVFFTYSYWDNENALNEYRNSDFFKKVWANTKTMFSDKPEAWSVERMAKL